MKPKNILIVLSFLILTSVFSCKKKTELIQELSFPPLVDQLYTEAEDSMFSNVLHSRELLSKALNEEMDSLHWALVYSRYVFTYLVNAEVDQYNKLMENLEVYFNNKDISTPLEHYAIADFYMNKINYWQMYAQADSSLYYLKKNSTHIESSHMHGSNLPVIYISLGENYRIRGEAAEAISYYRKALHVIDSLRTSPDFIPYVNIQLGKLYVDLHDFDMAHHYFDQVKEDMDKMRTDERLGYYNSLGNLYYDEGKYEEALNTFNTAKVLFKENSQVVSGYHMVLGNIGEIYLLKGQLDSAKFYIDICKDYFFGLGMKNIIYHLEGLEMELAVRKGDLNSARSISEKLLSDEYALPKQLYYRKKYLVNYYEHVGDYKNAYLTTKEYIKLSDSLRDSQVRMRVADIDMRYKQDTTLLRQVNLIQRQDGDIKNMRLSIYVWILVSGLVIAVAFFIYFSMKRQRKYLLQKHRSDIIEMRMENIRNRVSPHFIFNTLNRVVSGYKETDKNYQDLTALIKIMRLNLLLTEKLCITLDQELDFVNTYLTLEQSKAHSNLQINMDIDSAIDPAKIQIPSMMIQIPVENAIKHGFWNKEDDKKLEFSIYKEQDSLVIKIKDNGDGFKVQGFHNEQTSTGTGLKVLTQTIQLLNMHNKKPIIFTIQNNENEHSQGCVITYIIPDGYSFIMK